MQVKDSNQILAEQSHSLKYQNYINEITMPYDN